ncbi:MAG TPA: peptidyl-prolyl cis-trans isomerase [Thermoanaerobaculia bacterium]|nr:peptidyl-prolyl cis-trans isomerase [Thermoanaerobaculia bacterium]
MLNVFRENIKRLAPILWVVIAVFVLLVFADYQGQGTDSGSASSAAATVDGVPITYGEFERQYRSLDDRFREVYGEAYTPELAQQMGVPMQAMNTLISQRVVLAEARRMGLEPTEAELRRAILEVPALQDDQGRFIGFEEYRRVLRANRIPEAEFERSMREQVLLEKLNDVLAASVWISDQEVLHEARAQAETARIRWIRLTPNDVTADLAIGPDELAAYFEEHRGGYQVPERRRVAYLSVNVNTIRAELELAPEELIAYYDANPSEFAREEQVRAEHILLFVNADRTAEQARAELEAIRRRVEAGEDFQRIAQEVSEDEVTRPQGGDLGFFGRGRMTPQFEEAAFSGQPGELIGPIENQLGPRTGYHLIRVIARQEGGLQPFEEVENRIRVRLLNERARAEAELRANQLAEALADESDPSEERLREIAEREGVELQITEPFSPDEPVPGIGRGTPFTDAAFSLEPGALSDPVRVASGWAILDVLEAQPARPAELADVEEEVRQAALDERRRTLALERLQQARSAIDGGASFEEAVAGLGPESRESDPFDARGTIPELGRVSEVIGRALELEVGGVAGPIQTPGGPVLFEVTARERFDPSTLAEQDEAIRDQLVAQKVGALLQSVVEARRAELDINYSRQFLDTFVEPPAEDS